MVPVTIPSESLWPVRHHLRDITIQKSGSSSTVSSWLGSGLQNQSGPEPTRAKPLCARWCTRARHLLRLRSTQVIDPRITLVCFAYFVFIVNQFLNRMCWSTSEIIGHQTQLYFLRQTICSPFSSWVNWILLLVALPSVGGCLFEYSQNCFDLREMPWGPDCQVLGTRRLETCGWWTEGRSYKGDSPSSLVTQGHTDLSIILITQSENLFEHLFKIAY